jgi:hypothetical protein
MVFRVEVESTGEHARLMENTSHSRGCGSGRDVNAIWGLRPEYEDVRGGDNVTRLKIVNVVQNEHCGSLARWGLSWN